MHDGVSGNGFTGSGFSYNAKDLSVVQLEGNAVDGFDFTCICKEGGMQVVYF